MIRELEKEVKMVVTGQTPNKAMQRTASKLATDAESNCHPLVGCELPLYRARGR